MDLILVGKLIQQRVILSNTNHNMASNILNVSDFYNFMISISEY